jgi:hypothetical protein
MTLFPTAKLLNVLARLSEPLPKKPSKRTFDRKTYQREYMRAYRKRKDYTMISALMLMTVLSGSPVILSTHDTPVLLAKADGGKGGDSGSKDGPGTGSHGGDHGNGGKDDGGGHHEGRGDGKEGK